MPLVAAAVCPHPPLLVPEIAGAAASELDDLRAACDAAVSRLLDSGARTVVVLGAGDRNADLDAPFRGSFAPWGVPLEVRLGSHSDGPVGTDRLPLSLLVGAWLLNRQPTAGTRGTDWRMTTVGADEPVQACVDLGARLGPPQPWALLVMGDGSACRGEKAPGYADPRAEAYDETVARALAEADGDALLGLDPGRSTQLRVAGRAPWQVLAGAARAAGGPWRGELRYHAAPYGVGYLVANWERP
ncbi:class III extradiol dioxygenase subunit B-like domain-containing protein [Verrucosispora sp. WMMA2121]|uniref:class III extradiol dioxygenase subunit B-like domain-containing protein n=1 Tax=Verrucosispora sp. WMMA2121 TaxID=3015164 RepID=UPI0022B65A09|nr:class III extradiol dioxygenase subunit B-like domain-containing protein [Verrucosispora sp. WMMA2121]MCZ7420250.1 class III extradiol dioxygenase subunit B-like domain-containing protein [Verrucosispora sp. WMMA2121]